MGLFAEQGRWEIEGLPRSCRPELKIHKGLRLLPQRLRVGGLSWEQVGEGIMGRGILPFRCTSSGLCAGENLVGRDLEGNGVQVSLMEWAHLHLSPLARVEFGRLSRWRGKEARPAV